MAKPVLCIVGLGYVGMPLAHAFAKAKYEVIGFDVNEKRITELKNNLDRTNELTEKELRNVTIEYSTDPEIISRADVVILAIPTPVDEQNKPDLTLLLNATKTVARHFKDGAIIVYESTVYPGVTEDRCGPILKKESGGKSFRLGYSPERINPGDREHTIDKIVKVVAGQDPQTTDILEKLYRSIVKARIHKAPSIKVAEMAKAIENAQRDINIAYMNEIAQLCNKIDISMKDVLDAAKTKWNFLPFTPGLVGGHCIGVDPYYLIKLADDKSTVVKLIETARKINNSMANYIAMRVIGSTIRDNTKPKILVLGLTFKENVPDTRNSQSFEVISILSKECDVEVHDPYVTNEQLKKMGLTMGDLKNTKYSAIALLVPHKEYSSKSPSEFARIAEKPYCLFYDLKSVFERKEMEDAGFTYMAL